MPRRWRCCRRMPFLSTRPGAPSSTRVPCLRHCGPATWLQRPSTCCRTSHPSAMRSTTPIAAASCRLCSSLRTSPGTRNRARWSCAARPRPRPGASCAVSPPGTPSPPTEARRFIVPDDNDDRIDAYIRELFIPDDDALRNTTSTMQAAGLPTIQVPPPLGRLLGILVRAVGARRVLELGTLGGYSAIWMARALPADGRLISFEVNPHYAEVARANLARAGVAGRVEVRVGQALDLLPAVTVEAPFDLAFIDVDKVSYPAYLEWAGRRGRRGALIGPNNGWRGGVVTPPPPPEGAAPASHELNRRAAAHPRLDAIILPNRGGRDGILIAAVRAGGS